jgi:hypothetical protein
MATQKLEEKVQQHEEVVEASTSGCRSQSRAHGKAYEQVPALICDSYARRILRAATIRGGYFAHREQNSPPKYWGNISEIAHLNFTTPIIISVFNTKLGETPFQTHHFPMNMALSFSFCFILFCLSFSHPLHRIEFGQQKLFSKTFRFSMIFYSTLQIFGGGHF